jgi:hypothetical protein
MSEDWNKNTLDWDLNINFSHITEDPENKAKYEFCVINDEKGQVSRKMAKGWMLWDKGDGGGYVDKIGPGLEGKSAAKKEDDKGMHSSVPVGMASGTEACTAYLLYMPRDMYKVRVSDVHIANAKRQVEGVTVAAREVAASKGDGSGSVIREEGTLTKSTSSDVAMGNT